MPRPQSTLPRPAILLAAALPKATLAELSALFEVLVLPEDPAQIAAFLAQHGGAVRGMALRKTVIDAAILDALPQLEVIASYSAGLDNLDVAAALARGIRIGNSSQVLARDVANLGIGLALALSRDLLRADHWLRGGHWAAGAGYPLTRSLAGMRVGLLGLGSIGSLIAEGLALFGARIAYSTRSRKPVEYDYHPDAQALAAAVDMLIVTCPLSPETHHLVGADVLAALGPEGYVINIARGPVVEETALIAALQNGRLAGAALDVFEHEPDVPEALRADPRVILTPHIGSATTETRQRMADNVVDILAQHFGIAPSARLR